MFTARTGEAGRERAALRLRLAGVALGMTLLLLTHGGERVWAAAAIVAYAIGALVLRYGVPRSSRQALSVAGVVLDVLYASALVSSLPLAAPAWALYAFAIATAAHRFGAWGAVAATAGAIASYDVVLALRSQETQASDLWPIQVLIAFGVLCTELVLLVARTARDHVSASSLALAQQELASATEVDELLSRLVSHAVVSFGASGAGIIASTPAGPPELVHGRGIDPRTAADRITVSLDEQRSFVAAVAADGESRQSLIRDLAALARPILLVLGERDRQRRALEIARHTEESVRGLANEDEVTALLAQLAISAKHIGPASVIRRSDGALVAGETLEPDVVARLRDLHPPATVRIGERHIATVAAGPGLAFVVSSGHPIDRAELRGLETIGASAGGLIARAVERDNLGRERVTLHEVSEHLRDELRSRDDALASTVHELRTPLTSVTAYGQVISRNLQSALQQLGQLDRLIGDLRGAARPELALGEVDVVRLANESAQRQRLVSSATVDVDVAGQGPFLVVADGGRLAQVLDNVLGNAVKFSPPGSPIDLRVRRNGDEIVISVSDAGPGLSAEDVSRVFERYYRARTTASIAPGLGMGLAVSREIVEAHGGRIWAESEGPGNGSTFNVALPALAPTGALSDSG
jgi:signal transduction histidine kinase